jgi:hypothetical protein
VSVSADESYFGGLIKMEAQKKTGRRIHERTILLRFLGIILRVLRIEVSGYNVYKPISNHFCSRMG